jgi:hypothetical protein
MSALPPHLRDRILAAAHAEPSPTRPVYLRRVALVVGLSLACSLLLFFGVGGIQLGDRPAAYVAALGLGWGLLAGALLAATLGRKASPLGPRPELLAAVTILAPTLLGMLVFLGKWIWPQTVECDGPNNHDGRCFFFAVAFALPPLAAWIWSRRGRIVEHVPLHAAAFGSVTGSFGALLITLRCTFANLSHLFLGHVFPVIVVSVVASLLASRTLRLSRM